MFENFKERLQTVQQDFTTGMKTLSDKSKEVKVKKKQRHDEHLPQFSAGVELLSRYEDTWVTLHRKAKDCAKAGETVDGEVVMLSAHWEKRRAAVVELQEQLQQIPGFLTDLETCTNRIGECAPSQCLRLRSEVFMTGCAVFTLRERCYCRAPTATACLLPVELQLAVSPTLEADFEELRAGLMYLENLCGQCEQQRFRHYQLLAGWRTTRRRRGPFSLTSNFTT
ncbi:hypothetical protein J4Q44_G00027660 [Coregonus suidteri]|uniref:Dysbindin n=1 Tax=Coregonus suidteri TaxID=861788 RepID=A0AAN8NGM1_9TELE